MTILESLTLVLFALILGSAILLVWFLDKPERELRKARDQAQLKFYRSAGYVFEHIACDIVGFDRARAMFEDYCVSGARCFDHNSDIIEGKTLGGDSDDV